MTGVSPAFEGIDVTSRKAVPKWEPVADVLSKAADVGVRNRTTAPGCGFNRWMQHNKAT
ncbi:protein of unknown function [Pararobbsia alpina]